MIDLVTDLVGKTIEFRRYSEYESLSVRGKVRGAYVAVNQPHLIVEATEGLMAEGNNDLVTFALCDGGTRVVADAATVSAVQFELDQAQTLIRDFIELGPRPDRQYCEPTDEDRAIWEAWDSRFAALINRATELGVDHLAFVEPVAKE